MRKAAFPLELKYPAAIPIGHRVEVLWVKRDQNPFGDPRWETDDTYCAVKDLDTGIEHGMISDFAGLDQKHPVAARVTGRVMWCRLVTMHEGGAQHTETRLYIEAEEGAPPKRR